MSATTRDERTQILREAEADLLRQFPYHAGVVARWRPRRARVPTLGIALRGDTLELLYNPRFLESLPPAQRVGVLLHETHHVILGHVKVNPYRLKRPSLYVLACELTANEHIPRHLLPGQPAVLDAFPALPPGEDTATRYERLLADRSLRGHGPLPIPTHSHHAGWGSGRDVSQALGTGDDSPSSRSLARLQRMMGRGFVGSRVERIAARAGGGPLDWSEIIAAEARVPADMEPSYLRPSRRFPALVGIVPGNMRRRPRIMAAVDTSESMDPEILGLVNREVAVLARGRDVVVVQCDNQVRSIRPYRGPITDVEGRGGTDFRPVFSATVIAKARPDLIVYFTDGAGHAPETAPPGVPVVWCVTPGGQRPAAWGRAVSAGARLARGRRGTVHNEAPPWTPEEETW